VQPKTNRGFDVPIAGYVVNRVLPDELVRGDGVPPYLAKRAEMQRRHLDRIGQDFGDRVLAHVPELERDITGLPMIERMAHMMYGGAS
jgi:arsenite-transporting ATPase